MHLSAVFLLYNTPLVPYLARNKFSSCGTRVLPLP
jgi:hypothetical protein